MVRYVHPPMLPCLLILLASAAPASDLPVTEADPLWEVVPPAPMSTLQPFVIARVGESVVVGGTGGVEAWDPRRWTLRWRREGPTVRAVAALGSEALVVGDDEGEVAVHELRTGERRRSLGRLTGWVSDVAVSSDGDLVAAATLTGALGLWRLPEGQRIHLPGFDVPVPPPPPGPDRGHLQPSFDADELPPPEPVAPSPHVQAANRLESVAFLPGGDLLVAGRFLDQSSLVRVNLAEGTRTPLAGWSGVQDPVGRPAPRQYGFGLDIAPDGGSVALGYWGGQVEVWDLGDGGRRWTTRVSDSWAGPVRFSPDGRHLLVAAPEGLVRFDADGGGRRIAEGLYASGLLVQDGIVVVQPHHSRLHRLDRALERVDERPARDSAVDRLAWSPDGRLLAAGASNSAEAVLRKASNGRERGRIPARCVGIGGLRFDRTSEHLLVSSCDYAIGVSVYDVDRLASLPGLASLPTNGEAWFTADGSHVVVKNAFAPTSTVFTVPDGRPGQVDPRWLTPAGTSDLDVALAQWGHRSTDVQHWLNAATPRGGVVPPPRWPEWVFGGFSLDGRSSAGLWEEEVRVFRDGTVVARLAVGPEPSAVALSPDASRVAVGYTDGRVRVYATR